jgi:hypothetical protein
MQTRSVRPLATGVLVLSLLFGTPAARTQGSLQVPTLGEPDRVRLAEAFRLGDALGDHLWPGWSSAPFAVLLVTPDHGFLVRHPKPAPDFTRLPDVAILGEPVWSRPRHVGGFRRGRCFAAIDRMISRPRPVAGSRVRGLPAELVENADHGLHAPQSPR